MDEKDLTSFCRALIGTESPSGEEGEVAKIIADEMNKLGFDRVEIDGVGNVIGIIEGYSDSTIVFDGHMDTVGPGNLDSWQVDPFSAEIIDDWIVGRGAVDMKGSIAAMIYSASKLKEVRNNLYYVFVVHEEDQEGFGIKYFLEERKIKPDLVVLGEATGLKVAVGHRGRVELLLKIYGRASHSSMPDLGENALLEGCRVLLKIRENQYTLPSHPVLGRASIAPVAMKCSPGEIPVIPDCCEILLDRRTIPGESKEDIISWLKGFVQKGEIQVRRKLVKCYTGYKQEVEGYFPAWYMNGPFARRVAKLLGTEITVWRFSTDGAYTAGEAGLRTIGYGPGNQELAHCPNERISLKNLIKSVDGYVKIANLDIMSLFSED